MLIEYLLGASQGKREKKTQSLFSSCFQTGKGKKTKASVIGAGIELPRGQHGTCGGQPYPGPSAGEHSRIPLGEAVEILCALTDSTRVS